MAILTLIAFALVISFVQAGLEYGKCKPVGTTSITISWKSHSKPVNQTVTKYYVYFCKNSLCLNTSINFHLGCTVNATNGRSEYSCDIGRVLNLKFPKEYSFNYYIKTVYNTSKEEDGYVAKCPVSIEIQCPKPTGLELRPMGTGTLKLNWSPPTDMGDSGPMLFYFIEYYVAENPQEKFIQEYYDMGKYKFYLKSLLPYKTYHVYLRCALNGGQKKSPPAGPVIATTLEQEYTEPQDSIIFEAWSHVEIDTYQRNVTVYFKLPEKDKWNGRITKIRIFCYKDEQNCTNIMKKFLPFGGDFQHQYNATFGFLRRDAKYYIKADYCNSAGCSPPSRNQTIPPNFEVSEQAVTHQDPKKILTNVEIIVIVIAATLVLLIMVILLVHKTYCCRSGARREQLRVRVGELPPPLEENSRDEQDEEGQVDHDYATADEPVPRPSRTTLHPETTDFQSASVRSINSCNSIGGITDQSIDREGISALNQENGKDLDQENIRLLQRNDSPLAQQHSHRGEEDRLLPNRS